MKTVGVIGGGISGLSQAYFLLKLNPALSVVLFETDKIGGNMQTKTIDNLIYETGPRSIRVSPRCLEILEMANTIGIQSNDIMFSSTSSMDSTIYMNGKMNVFFPQGSFRLIRGLLKNPILLRMVLANFAFKPSHPPVDDESLEELFGKYFRFMSQKDKETMLKYLDAFQTGVFGGNTNELSGRWCFPFSNLFTKKYFPKDYVPYKAKITDENVLKMYQKAKLDKSNTMNFRYGLSSFTDQLCSFLQQTGRFTLVQEGAEEVSQVDSNRGVVNTKSNSYQFDHIISTVPSFKLHEFLKGFDEIKDIARSIDHHSILTINLGFNSSHNLTGVGYLVPSCENTMISGALYDSSQFPYQGSSVSLMSVIKNNKTVDSKQVIDEFYQQTKLEISYSHIIETYWNNVLPQYKVGHYLKVRDLQKHSPNWLTVAGQSFYVSGIANCVIKSKEIARDLLSIKLSN